MRKIVIKSFLFVGLIITIVSSLNNIVPTKSKFEKDRIDSLIANLNNIESITLGRSHAAALDYHFWDKKGFNLALGGRDFASINYLLKYFTPKMQNLKEVIIIISYSSFYFDNTALAKGNLNDARKALYYSIPSFNLIDKSDISNYVFGRFFPFIQANHGYSLIKKRLTSDTISDRLIENNWADNFMDSINIIRSAKKQADVHSFARYSAESYIPDIVNKNKEILIEIINYLQSENVSVLLVVPSYYKSYTEIFPQNDISEMKSILSSLAFQYNIGYYDLSNDSILSVNNIYYHNADHLNDKGKEIFTKRLKSLINNKK